MDIGMLGKGEATTKEIPGPNLDHMPPSGPPKSAGVGGENVDLQKWIQYRHSQKPLRFGLSFSALQVNGFLSVNNYQHTFSSFILALPKYLKTVFGNRRDAKVQILHSMDGLVEGGEMLLVLGRPGSGCSTFLKTIAGNTDGFHVSDDSSFNYQGLSYSQMHGGRKFESVYVAELDVHFPELLLGQTLEFAASARPPSSNSPKETGDSSRLIASMFNLKEAFNTPIGNDMIRGISGGEKKRVSIAEAFMSGSQLQCWDNSTRGLDSSTALDLIGMLRDTTDVLGSAVFVSVYQASEAIFNKFTKVMLLYEGRQIFFGPTSTAVQYFTSLGFVKPAQATSADFLTSLTSPKERIIAADYDWRVPHTPEDFAEVWKQSTEHQVLLQDIEKFMEVYPLKPENLGKYVREMGRIKGNSRGQTSQYSISTMQQINICLRRAYQRLINNSEPTISAIIGNSIIGIILGSAFYNLDESSVSIDRRALLLFFSIMMNACASGMEILTIWAQRPIVEKHTRYSFYHPFTEALASMICDLPNKILSSLFFNLALYFMTNLRRTPSAFFIFYLFSFTTLLTMSMVFRMMGSLSKRIEQSMAPGAIMILNFIIYTGFVIPIPYMVPWFGWMRWINPIAYAYESLMINEFRDRRFSCSHTVPSGPGYTGIGTNSTVCSSVGSKPSENFVEGAEYLWAKFRYLESHLWRNLGLIVVLMVGYCMIYLLAVEYIPTKKSKGEILLFRQNNLTNKGTSDEEKSDTSRISVVEKPDGSDFFTGLQKQTGQFHWENVCYDVKVKQNETRRILDQVDGWVKPGKLTALMGITGAGKTTLLDVLAARASTGVVSGDIYVDGRPRDKSFQRQTGYVQQADIHMSTSTVREALTFSALLRQPKTRTMEEKRCYVEHVLKVLEMESYADAIVGVPGEGLNVEQRRRLSIAVEMAARPELLLFLDEPTSGLDSQTAWSICTLLRKLADNGQAVLCTIHQPSSQLFGMFDQLLLLENGGRTLYFGDIGTNGSKMVAYFEKYGARTCTVYENPAEWMLDVTGATPRSESKIPWSNIWHDSEEKKKVKQQLGIFLERVPPTTLLNVHPGYSDEYASSYVTQLSVVIYRIFQEYWRTPSYLYSKVALCVGAAIFNGFSFYMSSKDIQGLTNIVFSIFLLTNIFTSVDQQIIPRFVEGRSLFEAREMPSKTYSWVVFITSHILVELAWQTLVAVLVFVSWYYPTGIWRNGDPSFTMNERAGLSFAFIWIFCVFSSTLSQAIAAAIEHAEIAVNIAQLFFYLCVIFCGVIIKPSDLPGFWMFMYRVSPLTYLVRGMVSAGLGNIEILCASTELLHIEPPGNSTCGAYFYDYIFSAGGHIVNPESTSSCLFCPVTEANLLLRSFGIDTNTRWRDFGIFCMYPVANVAMMFLMYWLVRVPSAKTKILKSA
ncbi:ABC transporter CDR4 [Tricladium varicosporioides]|nr:ABC transporter CDR4 [Hymenoscyphus varicosporioides]